MFKLGKDVNEVRNACDIWDFVCFRIFLPSCEMRLICDILTLGHGGHHLISCLEAPN